MAETEVVQRAREYAQSNMGSEFRKAFIEEARAVERAYSTEPIKIYYQNRIYAIPANYYSALGPAVMVKSPPYEIRNPEILGDWKFFWPTFEGFTKTNWFNTFDRHRINVVNFRVRLDELGKSRMRANYDLWKSNGMIEREPSEMFHGLVGHRRSNSQEYFWVGTRENGELVVLECRHPRDLETSGRPNPQCRAQAHESNSGEHIVYTFSLSLLEHWRAIDTGVMSKIRSWRTSSMDKLSVLRSAAFARANRSIAREVSL